MHRSRTSLRPNPSIEADSLRQRRLGLHFILGEARAASASRSCQTLGVVNTITPKSETMRSFVGVEFNTLRVISCANSKLRSQAGRAAVLRAALNEYKSSARANARARTNVAQSMGPQPSRIIITVTTRKASVALPRGLQLELGMQPFLALTATPNPSIERTRSGSAGLAFISFWAKPAPPPRAAHVKR